MRCTIPKRKNVAEDLEIIMHEVLVYEVMDEIPISNRKSQ